MTTGNVLDGKPYAGNPHTRFDEGKGASATPRRGFQLYKPVSCLFVLLASLAFAETDYSTWIYQTQSDTNANPSSTSGYSFGGGTFWSSKAKPAEGKNYYVPIGIQHYTPNKGNGPFPFPGDCLAVSGEVRLKTGSGKTVTYPELRLLDGSYLWHDSVGTLAGKLVVASSATNPAVIRINFKYDASSVATFTIRADLEADADAWVILDNDIAKNCTRNFSGDNSGFYGTMVLKDAYGSFASSHFASFPGTLAYACAAKLTLPEEFPGTAAAVDGYTLNATSLNGERYAALSDGTLAFSSARTFADLSIASNGVLLLAFAAGSAAVPTVTNSFSVAAGATVALSGLAVSDLTNMTSIALVRLAGVAAENPPDVSGLALRTLACGLPRSISLAWIADGDDKVLVASWRPVSMLVRAPPSKANFFTNEAYKDYWSDGELPQSGRDYYIGGFGAITWELSAVNFAGESLTFNDQQLYMTSASINAADMVINGLGSSTLYKDDSTWSGGLTVLSDGLYIRLYQACWLYLRSSLSGTGPVTFSGTTTSTVAKPYGTVEISGTNTAYGGRIKINTPISAASGSKPATPDYANGYLTRCYISDGRNFGGPFTADSNWYNAIQVDNYSKIVCRNSVTIDEPTRGLFISVAAQFSVPAGATLTLNNPVTYNGELIKTGAGVLALGGTALFTDGDPASEPQATSNVVSVTDGSLKPLADAATDGLDIRFSGSSALVLPAASATGLYGVRAGSSVSANTETGHIPTSFDTAGLDVADQVFTFRLVTAADAETAAARAALLSLPRRVESHAFVSTSIVENEDGTYTAKATYEQIRRFMVIIQ